MSSIKAAMGDGRALRLALGFVLALAAMSGRAEILPKPAVTKYDPKAVAAELEQFKAVGDGILLTLAACKEEPHCVTAMSRHELERLIDQIQQRIDHLQKVKSEGDLPEGYGQFLKRYRDLRTRYAKQLGEVQEVTQKVDAGSLEKDWEELLTFEAEVPKEEKGPNVPEPNKEVTLERFADVTEPIPLD